MPFHSTQYDLQGGPRCQGDLDIQDAKSFRGLHHLKDSGTRSGDTGIYKGPESEGTQISRGTQAPKGLSPATVKGLNGPDEPHKGPPYPFFPWGHFSPDPGFQPCRFNIAIAVHGHGPPWAGPQPGSGLLNWTLDLPHPIWLLQGPLGCVWLFTIIEPHPNLCSCLDLGTASSPRSCLMIWALSCSCFDFGTALSPWSYLMMWPLGCSCLAGHVTKLSHKSRKEQVAVAMPPMTIVLTRNIRDFPLTTWHQRGCTSPLSPWSLTSVKTS